MNEMRKLINLVESAEQQQLDEIDLKKAALTGLAGLSLAGSPDAQSQDSTADINSNDGPVATTSVELNKAQTNVSKVGDIMINDIKQQFGADVSKGKVQQFDRRAKRNKQAGNPDSNIKIDISEESTYRLDYTMTIDGEKQNVVIGIVTSNYEIKAIKIILKDSKGLVTSILVSQQGNNIDIPKGSRIDMNTTRSKLIQAKQLEKLQFGKYLNKNVMTLFGSFV